MWVFTGWPKDPDNDHEIEEQGAEALYSAVKSLIHAI